MNDYTHKRYLVRNTKTGETRTVTKRVGSTRYDSPLQPNEKVVACLGGYRSTTVNYTATAEDYMEE